MELYRVTRQIRQTDLSGMGAARVGGRWNRVQQAVLYTAGSRSLALLESIVHLDAAQPPDDYCVMVVYVPDTSLSRQISVRELPDDWRQDVELTQQKGTEWLKTADSLLLSVPSVIVKAEYNYLINPAHPDFREVKLIDVEPIEFDERFFRKTIQ